MHELDNQLSTQHGLGFGEKHQSRTHADTVGATGDMSGLERAQWGRNCV